MHNPLHGRYFFNRESPYWLQSSITGSAFRGFMLILQNNSMLKDTKAEWLHLGALIHGYTVSREWSYKVKVVLDVYCALIG